VVCMYYVLMVPNILTDLSLICSLSLVATMEVGTLKEENLVRSVRGGRPFM
jgi:hypothetical protein